jgi:hypothetical protein
MRQTLFWLGYLKLNGSSFFLNSFIKLKKKSALLILDGNHDLTYLDEKTFAPYFQINLNNRIQMINKNYLIVMTVVLIC